MKTYKQFEMPSSTLVEVSIARAVLQTSDPDYVTRRGYGEGEDI